MAGLLDVFGTGGLDSLSLLGMSAEDIKRARNDAQAQAMFALAGRLFQGGNTGASIAQGLQAGQQAYKQAMGGQLEDRMQNYQLQELIKKKGQEELALKNRQKAQQMLATGYTPATSEIVPTTPVMDVYGTEQMGPSLPQPAKPAGYDLSKVAPQLMAGAAGQEGIDQLIKMLGVQKAMTGESFKLGEGEKQYQRDPLTGQVKEVASGAPKIKEPIKPPSAVQEYEYAKNQGYKGSFQDFEMSKRAAGAPKIAVDLKDQTAVAKAQADLLKDWRGVVKDTGAMEVADRFKAAQTAVEQGNAGNKAADGALIYAIGKIYDPSGAVQEGDKKTILGNRSIPDSIKAYAQKAFSGQDLLPSERNALLSVASKIVEAKAKNLDVQKAPYISISKQFGGGGELLLNPLSDVLSTNSGDLASQAAAELARRRKAK